jgi:hypothetical protein
MTEIASQSNNSMSNNDNDPATFYDAPWEYTSTVARLLNQQNVESSARQQRRESKSTSPVETTKAATPIRQPNPQSPTCGVTARNMRQQQTRTASQTRLKAAPITDVARREFQSVDTDTRPSDDYDPPWDRNRQSIVVAQRLAHGDKVCKVIHSTKINIY